MDAAQIVAGARGVRGVTQQALAALAHVPQPSISGIERGHRDPTVQTLNRLLAPLGAQLGWLPTNRRSAATAAAVIEAHLKAGVSRLVTELPLLQLADDLAGAPPVLRAALCVCPPQLIEARYDAAIAALVEYRLAEVGIAAPDWVNEPSRKSVTEWLVCGVPALEKIVRADTPEPFLRRGVLLSATDLVSI